MADCQHCASEGRKVELTTKTVVLEYAKHLNATRNYPIQDSYLYCGHCGYYGVTA